MPERIENEIRLMKETRASIRSIAEKTTPEIHCAPGSCSTSPRKLENLVIKITELDGRISEYEMGLAEIRLQISSCISHLEDTRKSMILELRYLRDMSFTEIANEMHYSQRHIYRLHEDALNELEEKLPEVDAMLN